MRIVMIDNTLWAVAVFGELSLTAVLVARRRFRNFPWFTAFIAQPAIASAFLYPASRSAPRLYEHFYWVYVSLDFLLQFAVVVELTRAIMRPTGTLVRDARRQFLLWALAGVALAFFLSYIVAPPSGAGLWSTLGLRANLFTSLLICELMVAVFSSSNRLGFGWRNHVIAIGQGFTFWAIIAMVVDSLHSYFGLLRFYGSVEHLKSLAYLVALGYWSVQLWHDEPARQPISPELRNYIVALHRRVQYDLGEAEQ